jgi:hypothetical protein
MNGASVVASLPLTSPLTSPSVCLPGTPARSRFSTRLTVSPFFFAVGPSLSGRQRPGTERVHPEQAPAAVQRETRTIPIVFVNLPDPVASGIVERRDRPSGNIPGYRPINADKIRISYAWGNHWGNRSLGAKITTGGLSWRAAAPAASAAKTAQPSQGRCGPLRRQPRSATAQDANAAAWLTETGSWHMVSFAALHKFA